jgi:hypothetical protein
MSVVVRGAVGFAHRQSFVLLCSRVRPLHIPRRDVQNVPVIFAVVSDVVEPEIARLPIRGENSHGVQLRPSNMSSGT